MGIAIPFVIGFLLGLLVYWFLQPSPKEKYVPYVTLHLREMKSHLAYLQAVKHFIDSYDYTLPKSAAYARHRDLQELSDRIRSVESRIGDAEEHLIEVRKQ
jgi:hypothetical protein